MSIFNIDVIKKGYFKEDICIDGEAIYNTSRISFDELKQNMITDIYELKSTVHENENEYNVSISFKEKNDTYVLIGDRTCTCSYYTKTHENCMHMMAVILNANNYSIEEIMNNDNNVIYTSDIAKEIEKMYVDTKLSLFKNVHKYEVQPFIIIKNETISVNFKIGNEDTKYYIIRDIVEFIRMIHNQESHEYGKNFICEHKIADFKESSRHIIDFMESKIDLLNLVEDKKNIPITTTDFMFFYNNFNGRNLNIKYNDIDAKNYKIREEEIPFEVKIKDEEDIIVVLLMQTMHYISFINDSICGVSEERFTFHKINDINLLGYLRKSYKKVLKIKSDEFFAFYDNVLKIVSEEIPLNSNIDIESMYNGLPKLNCYVDLDDSKNVSIEIKVEKDNLEQNYFTIKDTDKNIQVSRKLEIDAFINYFGILENDRIIIRTNEKIYEYNDTGIKDSAKVFDSILISDSYTKMHEQENTTINLGINVNNNLLELDIQLEGIELKEISKVLSAYNLKEKYFRLKNGNFIKLNDKLLEDLDNLINGLNIKKGDIESGKIQVDKFHALYLEHIVSNSDNFVIKKDVKFVELLKNITNTEIKDYDVPVDLNASLREYQKYGFQYLTSMKENGFGIILADDMGLGKTIQMITFLLNDIKINPGKSLITCPSSLILNWEKEIKEFAPNLKVLTINLDGTKRRSQFDEIVNYDIVITSYDLLKRDIEEYQKFEFENFIIDESQYIKNSSTKNYKTVMNIKARTNIALTGTPIENKLSELWSIMNFVVPGYLNTYKKFSTRFEIPIIRDFDQERLEMLKKLCSPFILRRLKKDVLTELPEKSEIYHYVKMNEEQENLYRANIIEMKNEISQMDIKNSKLKVLSMLMRLRQISCDPSLVYDNYQGESAKLDATIEIIKNSIEGGHKVLLFSQFTSMLDIIKAELESNDISHYMLTGSTKKQERHDLAESFNEDDTSVFLISLKAGGTGLNLVGADIVIHFDPWWNMSAQNQATDRVYRIGQENNVVVYKMIADNTIEGKIVEMQEKKGKLAESILESSTTAFAGISEEELLKLFD
jgi:SNF2 family DNA or RNA helicase